MIIIAASKDTLAALPWGFPECIYIACEDSALKNSTEVAGVSTTLIPPHEATNDI